MIDVRLGIPVELLNFNSNGGPVFQIDTHKIRTFLCGLLLVGFTFSGGLAMAGEIRPFYGFGHNRYLGDYRLLGVGIRFYPTERFFVGANLLAHDQVNRQLPEPVFTGSGLDLGYVLRLAKKLNLEFKESVEFVYQNHPVEERDGDLISIGYSTRTGTVSMASLAAQLKWTSFLGTDAGYQYVSGTGNPDLGAGQSGPFVKIWLSF